MLICLGYLSSSTTPLDPAALGELVAGSALRNGANGLTGMLCYYDGSFLQFLEGEEAAVQQTFDRIRADPRHGGVIVVYRKPIDARLFPDWTMALRRVDQLSPDQQEFCSALLDVDLNKADAPAHRSLVEGFVRTFRSWVR
jgi:hypothetical protein